VVSRAQRRAARAGARTGAPTAKGLVDRAGDARRRRSPRAWGAFDVAHARFVLEHVADPLEVVRQMVRSVRSAAGSCSKTTTTTCCASGRNARLRGALGRLHRAIHVNRNDPYVGRRLPALLHLAGAAPRRSSSIFFGGCAGSWELGTMVENIVGIFEGARERLLAASQIAERDYRAAIDALRAWGKRPDAALWYSVLWAEGVRER
jgi:hypothetical protein